MSAEHDGDDLADYEFEPVGASADMSATISPPDEDSINPDDSGTGDRIEDEFEALRLETEELRDKSLRIQADFENYRKRTATQQAHDIDRATGRMAEALLPVLDACEAAFVAHPAEIEPLFNLLLGELRKVGLEAMNLQDQPFDPATADAVLHEPNDGSEPTVSEVLRTGYVWKGKVLRPAMVKVKG